MGVTAAEGQALQGAQASGSWEVYTQDFTLGTCGDRRGRGCGRKLTLGPHKI